MTHAYRPKRGIVIMAQNTSTVDYEYCAKVLAKNISIVMPNVPVKIVTIADLPYGDQAPNDDWKLNNDWQIFQVTPFDETIKLEADLFLPRSIEHWFDICSQQDVVVSSTIRNFKGEISKNRSYRKFIDENNLPDVYNGITYFKKSETSAYFYQIVQHLFYNWDSILPIIKCNPKEIATTDWIYALACNIVGVEKTTMPGFTEMSMTHMKQFINDLSTEDWTDSLVYEILPEAFRIQTFTQFYPIHYYKKSFAKKIAEELEWKIL